MQNLSCRVLRAGLSVALFAGVSLLTADALAVGTCGSGGVLGDREQVSFNGSEYYVTTPAGYTDDQPWPLILGLHGDEGDPADSVNWFWRDVTDDRFVFVAPRAPNASGSWYEDQDPNEVWMDELLAEVLSLYNVDLDRVYIWALSGGAMFISDYARLRQDVFAAAEWNMGGGFWGNYTAPETCKLPARFVVSPTDFLRDNALNLYNTFTDAGHETVWVDANCVDHCWEDVEMGPNARDWLLSHTLCGVTPTGGCVGSGGSAGAPATGGASGSSGNPATGGTSGASGSPGDGGAPATGGDPGAGGAPATGGDPGASGAPATGGDPAASGAPGQGGSPGTSGSTGTGASDWYPPTGAAGQAADGSTSPSDEDAGCSCTAAGSSPAPSSTLLLSLLALSTLGRRRRSSRG